MFTNRKTFHIFTIILRYCNGHLENKTRLPQRRGRVDTTIPYHTKKIQRMF